MAKQGRAAKYVAGYRRHKLVILAIDPSGTQKHPRFQLRCDCGNEYVASASSFVVAKSCRKCHTKPRKRKYGDRVMQANPLYNAWARMKHRCQTDHPKNKRWHGRGIRVCDEWADSYEAFEKWSLISGYKLGLSIDRVDNDGPYSPDNCEWVTRGVNSKRCRALYKFARIDRLIHRSVFYDEPCFGDY